LGKLNIDDEGTGRRRGRWGDEGSGPEDDEQLGPEGNQGKPEDDKGPGGTSPEDDAGTGREGLLRLKGT
jgi:hypothetical protein